MNDINKQRIRYIIEHYEEIKEAIKGKTFENITKDKKLFKAVQLDIIQIGEHISNLKSEIKQFIDLKEVNKLVFIRNQMVHEYKTVSQEDIKAAIENYIPTIIEQLNKIISKKYYLK